jgi:3-hydroxybutyryl-CoA dehydrogenase
MSKEISCAAIIGGGTMGGDIALIFAVKGWETHVVDPSPQIRKTLPSRLRAELRRLNAEEAMDFLNVHDTPETVPWDHIRIVVECVPENLSLKREVFARLEMLSRPDIPLTSNSSGLPISQIGKGLSTQHRMLGLHFFMPAHLVPLVEVVSSRVTDTAIAAHVKETMKSLGMRPVQVGLDIPGFLANRIQHALMREAISLVERGIATAEDVDTAVRYGFGLRYIAAGPLLQKDLSGLDAHFAAAEAIYPDLCNADSPSSHLRNKVSAGHIGIKAKRGFYEWTDEQIAREKARYEEVLSAGLEILKAEGR